MPSLAVFHATGQQGGSVIDAVLSDPELSKQYKIRALTRNTTSPKAQTLQSRGVEVVQADTSDPSSLKTALQRTDFVFAVTTPDFTVNAIEVELARAKAIADAAVASGVSYIIFSTLSPVKELSGGKLNRVYAYDAKAQAEAYIRNLPIKSAFFNGAPFMQNFDAQPFMGLHAAANGYGYVWKRNMPPSARLALIDGVVDTGKFVTPILANPDKYEGQTMYGAAATYSLDEISAAMSKATGKTVRYEQISDQDFHENLRQVFDSEVLADIFVDVFKWYEEFGAFGSGSEGKIQWSVAQARGRLTGLAEFLEKNPLKQD